MTVTIEPETRTVVRCADCPMPPTWAVAQRSGLRVVLARFAVKTLAGRLVQMCSTEDAAHAFIASEGFTLWQS